MYRTGRAARLVFGGLSLYVEPGDTMLKTLPVDSLDHGDLLVYRTLRQPTEHFRRGIFVAEGEKVVRRLLESPLRVLSCLLTPEWYDLLHPSLERRPEDIDAFIAPKTLIETIVGFHLHQGVMALGQVPEPLTLDELLHRAPAPRMFIALDGLTNSENIGVLTRTCAAFGVQGMIVGETSSSPFLRRAVRNSMGTVFHMPVVHTDDLVATIHHLREDHRITVYAAHPHANDRTLMDVSLTSDSCLVFGSEGDGISERVRDACDACVAIPMQNSVDSLNVGTAGGVFLYEAFRQRGGGRG